nr:hypothetical protein BaRGS_026289 [Batillaria attramentaria]
MVVVDEPAYNRWLAAQADDQTPEERHLSAEEAVRDFVRSMFASANLILQGMEQHGVRLDVRIQDIRRLLDMTALREFGPWLVRNGLEYDHAMLLTGYELVSPHTTIIEGYAYMNRMCRHDSLSVGHAFGAWHDGEPGRNDCDATSGYIMNDNDIGLSKARWNYSSCSAASILATLDHLSETFDCLSPSSTRAPPALPPYLGQLYSADSVCQLAFGSHSYACRHLYGDDREDGICDILWCLVNSTYCSGKASVDGVVCGAGKRCLAGQCVPFDDVPDDVSDTCLFGDVPHPVWRNRTCSDIVGSFTHNCLDDCCSFVDFDFEQVGISVSE